MWPAGAALLVGACSLLLPLGWSGLWAPYELEMAEFSRRIAIALHGAAELTVAGANDKVPTLSELGRGQLPFSSVAIGFQLFGLSDWGGRLPLALWALLGLGATYLLVWRLRDHVAAAYAVVGLATTPLYFLHARTLIGDGVTLAANAIATAGLALGTFYPTQARWARPGFVGLGLLGLLAGFGSRGALLGVCSPSLGVGLAWLIWRGSGRSCPSPASNRFGWMSLTLGTLALGAGVAVLIWGSPAFYLEVLGARQDLAAKLPTHDAVLHQLGFGLFPWSAVAPFALGLSLRPSGSDRPDAALRLCLINVFLVAFALHGLSAPFVGPTPFVGTFAIIALLGLAFRDAETHAISTRLLGLGTAALAIVFYADLRGQPEQSLGAFALEGATFPQSFAADAKAWLKYTSLLLICLVTLALAELPDRPSPAPWDPASEHMRWLSRVKNGWKRRLPLLLAGLTLLLGFVPLVRFAQARGVNVPGVASLEALPRLAGYAFLLVPLGVVAPLGFLSVRDAVARLLHWLPLPRPRLAWIGFTAGGLALSLGYYPALAAHLSPRDVFDTYRRKAGSGEALAVLGQAAQVAPYYAGGVVHTPSSARAGLDWLMEAPEQRRWLVFGSRDLGQLNHLYRQQTKPPENLPIFDATSSEVFLASNRLAGDERNENPLARWVSNERPTPQHPLDADLNGQLRCLGWSIVDRDGRPMNEIEAGRPYEFQIHWEVTAPIAGNWQTFIHIDGGRRRFNGDHDTLQGKYPFRFWQKGDFMTDVHPIELEPHFSGLTYQVYFGLFSGDKRLAVKSGRHHDDRLSAGNLVVR